MKDNYVLNFTEVEEFQNVVNLYQSGDGVSFIYKMGRPENISVKSGSDVIYVDSPAEINWVGRIDRDIYFGTEECKLYKAVFTPSASNIDVAFVREYGEAVGETQQRANMCTREIDGKTYVHRKCDDPEMHAILIDATESQLEGLRMKAVHRGKIIFERPGKQERPTIEKLTENIIVIGCVFPGYDFGFVDDSTPLIHNMITPTLEVFNTDTMEAHAVATDLPKAYFRVAGVHEGHITVQAGGIVFSAQLPERFIA